MIAAIGPLYRGSPGCLSNQITLYCPSTIGFTIHVYVYILYPFEERAIFCEIFLVPKLFIIKSSHTISKSVNPCWYTVIIGASLSEPHTYRTAGQNPLCTYIQYIYYGSYTQMSLIRTPKIRARPSTGRPQFELL